MSKLLVLHGPNLNLLGTREPEIYGSDTLADINARLVKLAKARRHQLDCLQSNAEHVLVDRIHAAKTQRVGYIVCNPGAFTHTSIALRDCLVGTGLPFVEVHLSNTAAREEFRHRSFLAPVAQGVVYGFGPESYLLGLRGVVARIERGRT